MSFAGILLVLIVALIVFDKNKLPELARTLGKILNYWQKSVNRFKKDIDEQLKLAELQKNIARAEKAESRNKDMSQ